jgi:Protein of unknown function (DUF3551)
MRFLVFLLGISVGIVGVGNRAEAQNYPWCAYYSDGGDGGGTNCGFTTFQQCLDTVSGIGGFCDRNTQYQPPPGPHPLNRVQRRYPY